MLKSVLKTNMMILAVASVMTGFSAQASLKPAKSTATSTAPTKIQLSPELSKDLNEFMALNADLFGRVGRNPSRQGQTFAAVIRCSDPQQTGHADDKAYCESEVIGDASLTEDVKPEALSNQLLSMMKKTKAFYGGSAQGWMGYDAEINCVTPNKEKPASCVAVPAMNDRSEDGFDDIDSGLAANAGAED